MFETSSKVYRSRKSLKDPLGWSSSQRVASLLPPVLMNLPELPKGYARQCRRCGMESTSKTIKLFGAGIILVTGTITVSGCSNSESLSAGSATTVGALTAADSQTPTIPTDLALTEPAEGSTAKATFCNSWWSYQDLRTLQKGSTAGSIAELRTEGTSEFAAEVPALDLMLSSADPETSPIIAQLRNVIADASQSEATWSQFALDEARGLELDNLRTVLGGKAARTCAP
jgi:hypothetical protein